MKGDSPPADFPPTAAAAAAAACVDLTGPISCQIRNTSARIPRLNTDLAPDPTETVDLPPNIHPANLEAAQGMRNSVNELYQHRQITGNISSPQPGQLTKVTASHLDTSYNGAVLISTMEAIMGPAKCQGITLQLTANTATRYRYPVTEFVITARGH
jgi:hypothetical protein